jgi:ssDNA-binding Zn-finger/Zn-ribbon topoisomerase 1
MSGRGATLVVMSNDNIITMQIALPPDESGFIGFECPSCHRYFKVVAATHTSSGDIHCTYCGHRDESGKFLTEAEVDYLKGVGAGKAIEQLHGQFQDMLLNAFRGSKNVKVTREQHSPPAMPNRPNERDMAQQNTCPKCALVYAFERDARVCPQCNTAAV